MKPLVMIVLFALAACGHPHGFGLDATIGGDDDSGSHQDGGGDDDGGHLDSGGGHLDASDHLDGAHDATQLDASGQGACQNLTICSQLATGLDAVALAVAVDVDRNVYVVGLSENDLAFDGHTLWRIGSRDAFVVSFTADGTYRWARRFGHGSNLVGAYAIAIDASSNLYIAGGLTAATDFGGGSIGTTPGQFIASFDRDGNYRWARADANLTGAPAIAVAGGQLFVSNRYIPSVAYSASLAFTAVGAEDVVVAAFDPATGSAIWARSLGTPATDDEGGLVAYGDWIAFSMSSGAVGQGERLISFSATGADRWNHPLDPAIDLSGLTVDATGNLYLAGLHRGGGDVVPGATYVDGDNVYVHSFDTAGASRWSWTLPEEPAHTWSAVPFTRPAIDPAGNVVLAGTYDGTLRTGSSALANGLEHVFLASFGPTSTPIAARRIDDGTATAYEWVQGSAIDSAGVTYVVGEYFGTPNFGTGGLPYAPEGGLLILRLTP